MGLSLYTKLTRLVVCGGDMPLVLMYVCSLTISLSLSPSLSLSLSSLYLLYRLCCIRYHLTIYVEQRALEMEYWRSVTKCVAKPLVRTMVLSQSQAEAY